MRGLKDKVTIVAVGAPGNIGGLTALPLAEEGSAVVAADLNEAAPQSEQELSGHRMVLVNGLSALNDAVRCSCGEVCGAQCAARRDCRRHGKEH